MPLPTVTRPAFPVQPSRDRHPMDSLTQFALGAVVATAGLGRTLGPRKAAIVGGLLGTLPDLDVFLPFADPVDSFVYHRGWSHSLFVHALVALPLGEALVRLMPALGGQRLRVVLTVLACLVTHALIDAMTIYGTRLFWPFFPDPVGVGSVFIIDPLYTLPLLVVLVWALFRGAWSRRLGRAAAVALLVSTSYLGLSVVLQARAEARALAALAQAGMVPERVLALAAPFSTLTWKVIALDGARYHNVYLSLLDPAAAPVIHSHPRRPDLLACLGGALALDKLLWFSRGFTRAEEVGDTIVLSDLRIGLTPAYVFRFALAERDGDAVRPIAPRRDMSHRRTMEGDRDWLLSALAGTVLPRPAEAARAEPPAADAAAPAAPVLPAC